MRARTTFLAQSFWSQGQNARLTTPFCQAARHDRAIKLRGYFRSGRIAALAARCLRRIAGERSRQGTAPRFRAIRDGPSFGPRNGSLNEPARDSSHGGQAPRLARLDPAVARHSWRRSYGGRARRLRWPNAEQRKRFVVWERDQEIAMDIPRVALLATVGVAVIAASFFLSLTIFQLLD
jgi:hypothetical protein